MNGGGQDRTRLSGHVGQNMRYLEEMWKEKECLYAWQDE